MAKKCPPGVICIENMTIVFLIIISLVALYIIYVIHVKQGYKQSINQQSINQQSINQQSINQQSINQQGSGLHTRPAFSFSNIENDVLLNPYEPPLRDNRIFLTGNGNIHGMPINVPTQSFNSTYRQVGLLTRIGAKETTLPLMGRPLIVNRDKWNFYTLSETNAMLKLPISHRGRQCMDVNGCNDLYTGDRVKVEGYHDMFKVTTYDNNTLQYIPYL